MLWFALHTLLMTVLARIPLPKTRFFAGLTHTFADAWLQWDGVWYALIGRYGYALPNRVQRPLGLGGNPLPIVHLQGAAFFPLVPLVVHTFGTMVAILVGNVALLFALVVAYRLFVAVLRPWEASVAVGLCALSPAMVFDSALYSDVYVILFSLVCLYAVGRAASSGKGAPYFHALACVSAVCAGLAHELGVLVMLIGLRYVRLGQWSRAVTYSLSSVSGWVLYSLYLGIRFHAPLAMFRAEAVWGHAWRFPGYSFVKQFLNLQQAPLLPFAALFAAILSATYVLYVLGFHRTDRSFMPVTELNLLSLESGLFAGAWVLVGLTTFVPSTPISGVLRLLSMCWPAFSGILLWLPYSRRRILAVSALLISALFGCLFTVSFTHGYAVF